MIKRKRHYSRKVVIPYLFIAPAVIILVVFSIFPIFQSIWLAFTDYNIIKPAESIFVGLQNFKDLVGDEYVWNALINTVYYSVGTVVPGMVISLAIALIITEPWFKFQALARATIFIPFILSMTIVGLMWSWLYSPSFGLFNYLFGLVGLPQMQFIGDPNTAMLCVIIMAVWKGIGYNTTIWSAGILGLSKEYRDAAKVDGATWLQELFRIRIPLLRPVILFLAVLGFIGSFQVFDAIYVLTGGGPMNRTEVLVFYLWRKTFGEMNISYGSAIAWLIFAILIVLTLIQFRFLGKEEKL